MADSSAYLKPEILSRIGRLNLRASRPMHGAIAGQHRSPLHGVSPEFADHREYAPGDDLKNLDWRVYARSNRHYIKRYEEESNLRATIMLDVSASMGYRPQRGSGRPTKHDFAATLTATLAALLMRQRDAVGLVALDSKVRVQIPPAATQAQLAKILELLGSTTPGGETELGPLVAQAAERIRPSGMVILISDLLAELDPLYQSLGKLQHQGHDILLFHVLDPDELALPFNDTVLFRDIEGGEQIQAEPWGFRKAYCQAMQQFVDDVRQRCHHAGIDYLQLTTDVDLGLSLSHWLHERSRRPPIKHRGRMTVQQEGTEGTRDQGTKGGEE